MIVAMLIQLPALRQAGFNYSWSWNIKHPEVRGIFANLLPIFLGTAVNQIYLAINRYFASGLSEGSISALNYAGKLMNLPMGIFVLAVASAIFPTLSEHAVKNDKQALGVTLNRGLKMVLLVTLPAAVGLMVLNTPIVKLLFERGAFDAGATQMTARALFYFSLGMFAMAVNMVLTRAYYAVQDVRTPLYIGFSSIIVNIIASKLLVGSMGHSGLALANSIAAIFSALAMYLLLKRHLSKLNFIDLATSVIKAVIASMLTAGTAIVSYNYMTGLVVGQGSKYLLIQVMVSIALAACVYAISILLLREKEVLLMLKRIRIRLGF
jgi:putative peptidoglycan lipid II flippase